jgi:hypothetical protein
MDWKVQYFPEAHLCPGCRMNVGSPPDAHGGVALGLGRAIHDGHGRVWHPWCYRSDAKPSPLLSALADYIARECQLTWEAGL